MTGGTLIPAWLGVSMGLVVMVVVAGHAMALRGADVPASRRRIRQANAGLMLVLVPLLTAGTSLISAQRTPHLWMQVWLAALLLLGAVIAFAALDMVNTARLARHRRAQLAEERATLEREAVEAIQRARAEGEAGDRV